MERKRFYDEIYEDIIRSMQKLEDGYISERYACFYDYFLDLEVVISQNNTFNFSNERCSDTLGCVAKLLLPIDCHALFPVFTKGDGKLSF